MEKTKEYRGVFLLPEHIIEIANAFRMCLDRKASDNLSNIMSVTLPNESWQHDEEAEFFSDIRKHGARYSYRLLSNPYD